MLARNATWSRCPAQDRAPDKRLTESRLNAAIALHNNDNSAANLAPTAPRTLPVRLWQPGGVMAVTAETRKRSGKARDSSLGEQDLLKAYRSMLLIRRFEEKAGQLYGMGLIGGFCHLYIGQEAV